MFNVSYMDFGRWEDRMVQHHRKLSGNNWCLLLVPKCPVVFIGSAQMASGETEARPASPSGGLAELG